MSKNLSTLKELSTEGIGRRQFMVGAGVAAGAALAMPAMRASAAEFPSRPVQLVVPFGTGGGSDRTMRLFAP